MNADMRPSLSPSNLSIAYSSSPDTQLSAAILTLLLDASSPLILLLSGGSLIDVYRQVAANLPPHCDLHHVTVGQVDERAVPIKDPQSNQAQLISSGIVDAIMSRGGEFVPIVDPEDLHNSAQLINHQFGLWKSSAMKIVAVVGIGEDGHTAGVLPHNDPDVFASRFQSQEWYTAYTLPPSHPNPHKVRITLTLTGLSKCHRCLVYATSPKKQQVLRRLIAQRQPLHQMPAQIVHEVDSVLYTDCAMEIARTSAP